MPLSEAEHPVKRIVPLPLSTMPGRTCDILVTLIEEMAHMMQAFLTPIQFSKLNYRAVLQIVKLKLTK